MLFELISLADGGLKEEEEETAKPDSNASTSESSERAEPGVVF